LELCKSLGDEAMAVKTLAEKNLPVAYYSIGTALLKEKKYDEAIASFESTYDIAEQYNSTTVKNRCKGYLPQLYYNKGTGYYKSSNYPSAIECFNKAIQWNQNYFKAHLGKGNVYKKQGDLENLKLTMAMAKQVSVAKGDITNANKADKLVSDFLIKLGANYLNNNKTSEAVVSLEEALFYGENNIETLYWLSSAYNKQGKYDKAITSINKAISIEKGGNEKAARLYYELGTSYKGKRDTGKACESFKKAKFGKYIESATYEITEVLKCDG
jgi:tetratricopeptide (TPR) repeat protein